MKKIKKHTRLVGKFGGKRLKTTTKKWLKMMTDSPDTPVSFREDDVTDEVAEYNELLNSVREKLMHGGELTEKEQAYVDSLKEKMDEKV